MGTQWLLDELLEVSPEETWDYGDPESGEFEFTSTVALSDTAVDHLVQLPHLRTRLVGVPPPTYSHLL